jgi:N-acetylglucosaminyldiphosphoundecaprenol N-acetyl-beta-D-mannosaminyltransferase
LQNQSRVDVLGVGFDAVTPDAAVSRSVAILESRGGAVRYVVTPNPEIVESCRRDTVARDAVENAALVLPDGIGVIYAAKILGRPLKTRVTGIDYAAALLEICAERGYGLYLLGAKSGIAEVAADKLRATYDGLRIVGTHDGYFSDDAAVIAAINAAEPHMLFVCLGAPRQETWIARNAEKLDARLAVCLGGALDVWAGIARRAPVRWQKLGLEWLYRLLREPRRIGRMIKLPLFLVRAVGARIRGGGHG